MRTAFTIELPRFTDYPDDKDIVRLMRDLGWDANPQRSSLPYEEQLRGYQEEATRIMSEMPEVPQTAVENTVFVGADSSRVGATTHLVVTRSRQNQMTIWLLNKNSLHQLLRSSEEVLKEILKNPIPDYGRFTAVHQPFVVHSGTSDLIILRGQIMRRPFVEALKENPAGLVLSTLASVLILVIILTGALQSDTGQTGNYAWETLTSSVTTLTVTAFNVLASYVKLTWSWKRGEIISWDFKET